jgi:hypothetical protein
MRSSSSLERSGLWQTDADKNLHSLRSDSMLTISVEGLENITNTPLGGQRLHHNDATTFYRLPPYWMVILAGGLGGMTADCIMHR